MTNPLIGVLSDTHDQVHYLERVMRFFNQKEVALVIHCGDWIAPFTLQYYKALQAPIYGVFGNNDGDKFLLMQVVQNLELNLTLEDQLLTLEKFERKMAVYHGTSSTLVDALVGCGDYDVVFYGHNHQAKTEHSGQTLAMNPGTLMDITFENVRGASVGLYSPHDNSGQLIPIEDLGD